MCVRDVLFVNLVVHLLSLILTISPAHVHLDLFISFMISLTPVWFLIHMAVFLFIHVMLSIALSWARCLVLSLRVCLFGRFHVSYPYVTVGSMHCIDYTLLFNIIDMFDLATELARPKDFHPSRILRLISYSMEGYVKTCWPR